MENQLVAAGSVDPGDLQKLHYRVDGHPFLEIFCAGGGVLCAVLEHVHFGRHVDCEYSGFDEASH